MSNEYLLFYSLGEILDKGETITALSPIFFQKGKLITNLQTHQSPDIWWPPDQRPKPQL